jgi:hypothetical protein
MFKHLYKVENKSFKQFSFWSDQIILNQDTKNEKYTNTPYLLGYILVVCIFACSSIYKLLIQKNISLYVMFQTIILNKDKIYQL